MKTGMTRFLARVLFCLSVTALPMLPSCSDTEEDGIGMLYFPVEAFCEVNVIGIGWIDAETDYLPHVIQCENGGADMEALKAQAVAARSYMYYKMASSGSVQDGTGDQVYSCGRTPTAEHMAAVAATAGQVLTYSGVVICAFYVAGADPSNRSTCVATGSDSDPTNTERYVTYNEGLSGNDIEQTTLGWVDPGNVYNRGCKSQWGARCLDERDYDYTQILRFYYGADIGIETAEGSCITPVCTETDPTCDGLDDDCDGSVDEDYVPTTCGTGACQRSSTCSGGVESCTPGDPAASDETCDGVDDDCDGETDEDCVVPPVDAQEDVEPDAIPDAPPADLPSDTVIPPDTTDDRPVADVTPPDGQDDGWTGLYEMGLDGGCGCTVAR
jgi:hypothetical protein